jgi:hypothetical protein
VRFQVDEYEDDCLAGYCACCQLELTNVSEVFTASITRAVSLTTQRCVPEHIVTTALCVSPTPLCKRQFVIYVKIKVKQSRYTPWRRLGGEEYSSYSFTTSALDGGEGSASRPGRALPPEKGPPVPIVQGAGWAPEPVWTERLEETFLAPAGDRTPIARSSSP